MAEIERIEEASTALERCGDLFRSAPIVCNPIATSLYPGRASALLRLSEGADTIGAVVAEGSAYTVSPLSGDGAAELVAEALPIEDHLQLTGDPHDAARIAGLWSQRCDGAVDTVQLFRWYRLGEPEPQRKRKGSMRISGRDRIEAAVDWMIASGDDIGLPIEPSVAIDRIGNAVNESRLMEWHVDDEVVSQLIVSPARFGVVRIHSVYTPPALRKEGFSGTLTAAVAAQQIARQKVDDVVLDTPASSASTNRMYRRLGFTSVHETLVVKLVPPRHR